MRMRGQAALPYLVILRRMARDSASRRYLINCKRNAKTERGQAALPYL